MVSMEMITYALWPYHHFIGQTFLLLEKEFPSMSICNTKH